jgi:hypothetical protein
MTKNRPGRPAAAGLSALRSNKSTNHIIGAYCDHRSLISVLQERKKKKNKQKKIFYFLSFQGFFFELLPLSIPNSYTMLTRAFP